MYVCMYSIYVCMYTMYVYIYASVTVSVHIHEFVCMIMTVDNTKIMIQTTEQLITIFFFNNHEQHYEQVFII